MEDNVYKLPESFQFSKDLILIDEGEYELIYHQHGTNLFMGKIPKLVIWFKVISQNQHHGVLLPRYYNVARIDPKNSLNGLFDPKGPKSDFVREFTSVCGHLPEIYDESLDAFEEKTVIGKVQTVSKDAKGESLHELLRYSKITHIYSE